MTPYRRRGAIGLELSLRASACGGDDSGGGDDIASGSTQANAVKDEVDKIDLGGSSTAATPAKYATTMDEREKLWASERSPEGTEVGVYDHAKADLRAAGRHRGAVGQVR